jgi:cobalt/nickel transport system permease protein
MHIPDAVLDPKVALATALIASGGLAYGLRALRDQLRERTTVLMGSMAAFVFAAQMVNFPLVVVPGASGHLLGGVLAAVLLGPWAGSAVIAAVLLVQCFLFQDGGLTALGANFVNMGLIGSAGGYAIYAPIRRAIGGHRGILIGAMAAAWFSVILSSGAFAVELAAGGRWGFLDVLGWMTLVHAPIGVGEALITGMVVRFLLLTRPDLLGDDSQVEGSRATRLGGVAVASLAISMAVAIFLAPIASASPDGLEYGGAKVGFLPKGHAPAPQVRSPIPDYVMPGLSRWKSAATAAAGVVGTLVVFGVGIVLARSFAGGKPGPARGWEGIASDAI